MHDTVPPTTDKSPMSFPRPHLGKPTTRREHPASALDNQNRQPDAHSTSMSVNQVCTRRAVDAQLDQGWLAVRVVTVIARGLGSSLTCQLHPRGSRQL